MTYSSIDKIISERRKLERYNPPNFHLKIAFFIIDDYHKTIMEALIQRMEDFGKGPWWKKRHP